MNLFFEDKELIQAGDFNLPSIDWSTDVPVGMSLLEEQFLDLFSSLGLVQWVKQATYLRSNNILDLIFTTENDRISNVNLIDPFSGCDHFPSII